jgi:pyruvate/oxaloacetate carboxyltransferase
MAVAVRYFRNNPWERIRRMRAAMPRTPLQLITTGLRFIAWQQADPEFMRLVYRRLQANGIRRFIILDPDARSRRGDRSVAAGEGGRRRRGDGGADLYLVGRA